MEAEGGVGGGVVSSRAGGEAGVVVEVGGGGGGGAAGAVGVDEGAGEALEALTVAVVFDEAAVALECALGGGERAFGVVLGAGDTLYCGVLAFGARGVAGLADVGKRDSRNGALVPLYTSRLRNDKISIIPT